MRKVGKAAAVALMTPLAAAAITLGITGSASAEAASTCPSESKATITHPSGPVTVGSRVHLSATVKGLLSTRLQISGGGVNERVDQPFLGSTIEDDVTVSEAGKVSLTVIGNITGRTYACASFSVSAQATGAKPKPTHSKTPSKSPTAGSDPTAPGSAPPLPTGTSSGTDYGSGAGVPGTQSLNNPNSPFSLPSLAPNGSGIGFQYPTPDPQIAEPAAKQVRADDASATSPIKWGQSIAAALVLLLLSAHFGMWSRRQRLAAEARAAQAGPAGKPSGRGPASVRRRRRTPVTELAAAGTATSDAAKTGTPTGAEEPTADADKVSPSTGAGAESAAEGEESTPGRGGYRGRRRRG